MRSATRGRVTVGEGGKVGYLPQHLQVEDGRTLVEEASRAFEHLFEIERRIAALNEQLTTRTDYESESYMRLIEEVTAISEKFYAEACEAIQARVRRELAALEGKVKIEETPDVAPDKLFDAIVAPCKGKVVLVDFWNTWCGPCQAAIKANEPLKTGELKSDDIVWIYLANETSPLVTYKTQIGKIAGKHYRLNEEQWKYLCEKFKVDGIPSYVLVDRDGNSKLRNDLRNHDKLKKTLKKMIE